MHQERAAFAGLTPSLAAAMPPFDETRLLPYLQRESPQFGSSLALERLAGGRSNPTFLLTAASDGAAQKFVLRRKPHGALAPSAHQVEREYRVMRALEGNVPVPEMVHLCTDPSIIGSAFYIMQWIDGRVFRDAALPGMTPIERSAVYDELNRALATLHQLDPVAIGLADYGRPGNYFERQIARWTDQYKNTATENIPEMDELARQLPRRIPEDASVSIVHGDYRLENVIFHPTEPRLVAVLDWELSTLGHPLADLSCNAFLWHSKRDSWGCLTGVDFSTSGIPTEAAYVEAYCRRAGRACIEDWPFYMAFSAFRMAAIAQGVYFRHADTLSEAARLVNSAPMLARQALSVL